MSPRHLLVLISLCVLTLLVSHTSSAADDWVPSAPTGKDGFDWIELKSGEWLKVSSSPCWTKTWSLTAKNECKSVGLERHTHPAFTKAFQCQVQQQQDPQRSILVTRKEVLVVNHDSTRTIPRSEIFSIIPEGGRGRGKLSVDVSLGPLPAKQHKRNHVNTEVTLGRVTPLSQQELSFKNNYAELDNDVSKDNSRWTLL